jgi:hypothetical protein
MSRELTEEEREAFFAEQASEKKVVKKQPRYMTPEEVRTEAGEVQPYQKEHEGRWPPHESFVIRKDKRVSTWEEGIYNVEVVTCFTKPGKDNYHLNEDGSPKDIVLLHVGFLTDDDDYIEKRMTITFGDRSTLPKFLAAVGAPPDEVPTDDLVGKKLKVMVKNLKNKDDHEWETITEFFSSKTQFKSGGVG